MSYKLLKNEQKLLEELSYSPPLEFSVPYMLGLAEFLTKYISLINRSMELLFDRFSKTPMVTESIDIIPIRHWNSHIPYTGSETVDNGLDSWERESLVATTPSLLMLLLYFKLFEYLGSLGRVDSNLIHSVNLMYSLLVNKI